MKVTVVSSLLVAAAGAELLEAGRLPVQQRGVRPAEPDQEAQRQDDH